jgi:hypothetical protein
MMGRWIALLLVCVVLGGCQTVKSQLGVPGGRTFRAALKTLDGATIAFWRWTPTAVPARKVLVIPELGFDHRLVASLCADLREQGFDTATLDSRESTQLPGDRTGLAGWLLDVARAVRAHGPKPYVVAIGVGGEAGLALANLGAVAGVVAINVPFHHELNNVALRQALAAYHYDPQAWLDTRYGPLLLGAGRSTPLDALEALSRATVPVSTALQTDVEALLKDPSPVELPHVPMEVLLSVKDNFVPTEDAFPPDGHVLQGARRLGRMEMFERDYGHVEWLVDEDSLAEIAPAIVHALEALP